MCCLRESKSWCPIASNRFIEGFSFTDLSLVSGANVADTGVLGTGVFVGILVGIIGTGVVDSDSILFTEGKTNNLKN